MEKSVKFATGKLIFPLLFNKVLHLSSLQPCTFVSDMSAEPCSMDSFLLTGAC